MITGIMSPCSAVELMLLLLRISIRKFLLLLFPDLFRASLLTLSLPLPLPFPSPFLHLMFATPVSATICHAFVRNRVLLLTRAHTIRLIPC